MTDERKPRGFAALTPEQRYAICSKGGKAAHAKGVAHVFSGEKAREAGRKGGEIVASNRKHMAEIGRRGGEVRREKRQLKSLQASTGSV